MCGAGGAADMSGTVNLNLDRPRPGPSGRGGAWEPGQVPTSRYPAAHLNRCCNNNPTAAQNAAVVNTRSSVHCLEACPFPMIYGNNNSRTLDPNLQIGFGSCNTKDLYRIIIITPSIIIIIITVLMY